MGRKAKVRKIEADSALPFVTHLGYVFVQTERTMPGFPQITYVGHAASKDTLQNFRPPQPVPKQGRFWLCLNGQARVEEAGRTTILNQGEGFIVESDNPQINCHCVSSDLGIEFLVIFFKGETILTKIRNLVEQFGRFQKISPTTPTIQRFLALTEQKHETHSLRLKCSESSGLTWSLFHDLIRSHEQHIDAAPSANLAREAQILIRDAVEDRVSISEIAASLGVSREHMTRVFQQHFGVSPHRYLNRLKVERACILLKETTLPHKTIAANLGFQSRNAFYQLFKRIVGMTPDTYRRSDHWMW